MNTTKEQTQEVLNQLNKEIVKIAGSQSIKDMMTSLEGHFEGAFKLAQFIALNPNDMHSYLVDVLIHGHTLGYVRKEQLYIFLLAIIDHKMGEDPLPKIAKALELRDEENSASS